MISKEILRQITGHDPGKYALGFSKRVLAMSQEKMQSIRASFPSGKMRGVSSGTTIVAMKFKDGVLLASDRQVSAGYQIWGEYTKISQITKYSLWGAAGMVACIQEFRDRFKSTVESFECGVGRSIHVDGQASIMTHILRENFEALSYLESMFNYSCDPLLVGWDPEEKRGRIFVFGSAGETFEASSPGYAVVGSGGDYALSVLDDRWRTKLGATEAAKLAMRALLIAGRRDTCTSDSMVYPSTIWVVGDHGIQMMSREDALNLAWKVGEELHGRKGSEHILSIIGKRGAK